MHLTRAQNRGFLVPLKIPQKRKQMQGARWKVIWAFKGAAAEGGGGSAAPYIGSAVSVGGTTKGGGATLPRRHRRDAAVAATLAAKAVQRCRRVGGSAVLLLQLLHLFLLYPLSRYAAAEGGSATLSLPRRHRISLPSRGPFLRFRGIQKFSWHSFMVNKSGTHLQMMREPWFPHRFSGKSQPCLLPGHTRSNEGQSKQEKLLLVGENSPSPLPPPSPYVPQHAIPPSTAVFVLDLAGCRSMRTIMAFGESVK